MKKMKRQLLMTFLLCALALTGFTMLPAMQVSGASADAKILSYSWYVAATDDMATYAGDLVVVGELQNIGTTNIFSVYVLGTAFVNGEEVAYASRQVFGNNLQPSQKAPFYLDFLPQNYVTNDSNWMAEDVTDVIVTVGYTIDTDENMYQGLTVSSQGYGDSDVYTVIGSVKNDGTETVGDVRVITTFYDNSGTVVSLNYTEILSSSLSPGASKNFIVTPVDNYPGYDIASYEILVQSTSQQPSVPSPTPSSTIFPIPNVSASAPAEGSIILSGFALIIIAVILVVVAIVAIVLVVLLIHGKRRKPL